MRSIRPPVEPHKFETCPDWGATTFLRQLEVRMLLTAARTVSLARIRHIPQVLAGRVFSPIGREAHQRAGRKWVVKLIDVFPDEVPSQPELGGYQFPVMN
jgi:hypothetical protein